MRQWIHGNYCFGKNHRALEVFECFYAGGGRQNGKTSAGWKARFKLSGEIYAETSILPTQMEAEQALCGALNELIAERHED